MTNSREDVITVHRSRHDAHVLVDLKVCMEQVLAEFEDIVSVEEWGEFYTWLGVRLADQRPVEPE